MALSTIDNAATRATMRHYSNSSESSIVAAAARLALAGPNI